MGEKFLLIVIGEENTSRCGDDRFSDTGLDEQGVASGNQMVYHARHPRPIFACQTASV